MKDRIARDALQTNPPSRRAWVWAGGAGVLLAAAVALLVVFPFGSPPLPTYAVELSQGGAADRSLRERDGSRRGAGR